MVWRPTPGLDLQATFLQRQGDLALCRFEVGSKVREQLWLDGLEDEVLVGLQPLENLLVRWGGG